MIAHGLAVQAIRAANRNLEVGITLDLWMQDPASDSPEDIAAAALSFERNYSFFIHAIFKGYYPLAIYDMIGEGMPCILDGDMAIIAQELDFLGINNYSRHVIGAQGKVAPIPGSEYTEMGWEVHAPALRRLLNRINGEYRLPPIYITENGAAFKDEISPDGKVHDPRRVDYLKNHILQIRHAMQDGVDVRGYFVWSLLDNFEWAYGFTKRFGIVRVDYDTQQRIVKDSGEWYRQVIADNFIDEER
jgi:beta-glucosidase